MDGTRVEFLDTPKRTCLKQQAGDLRMALKDFERTFAEQYSRKPKQVDIKNDATVAEKYKQYQRVQDVLTGKLAYETLVEIKPSKRQKSRIHNRQDSGVGSSPQKQRLALHATPTKSARPLDVEEYDIPVAASPQAHLLSAVGPTPHRDGKVLGLFDMIQRSSLESGSAATPSSSIRKRKIDELYEDTPGGRYPLKVIQTPSRRPNRNQGDLLDFLADTPQKSSGEETKKHHKTPQSEGRRFELSQFFATPSTQRYLFAHQDVGAQKKTPLRESVLDQTPRQQLHTQDTDRTPQYLRRSTSFKDRLLSASKPAVPLKTDKPSPPSKRIGPPTLRHFRSSTSGILQMLDIVKPQMAPPKQQRIQRQEEDDDDDEDALEALHETNQYDDDLEALLDYEGEVDVEPYVLVEDSQIDITTQVNSDGEAQAVSRPYKKKGQKRTTRKSNIKPVVQKAVKAPTFVAADDFDVGEEHELVAEEETQLVSDNDDDLRDLVDLSEDESNKRKGGTKGKIREIGKNGKPKRQAGMINPNAQSHQNFRTVKIKNRSTKANSGRAKFSGRRR